MSDVVLGPLPLVNIAPTMSVLNSHPPLPPTRFQSITIPTSTKFDLFFSTHSPTPIIFTLSCSLASS